MSKFPEGRVRPLLTPPAIVADELEPRHTSYATTRLTKYQFHDTSSYTTEIFDYRLKWTLKATKMAAQWNCVLAELAEYAHDVLL